MKANYSDDPNLYERCLSLIDSCFPGIKALADKGRKHNSYWDKVSTPFVSKQGFDVVAHIGVLPFHVIMESKPYEIAAIHAVCVKPSLRGQGIYTQLMKEVMEYVKNQYDFSILFADNAKLYEPFGFRQVPEYDFVIEGLSSSFSSDCLRQLNLNNPKDLALMQHLLENRLPVSPRFGIVRETFVFTLTGLQENVYYSEKDHIIVLYKIQDRDLYVKDMVFTKPYSLEACLELIPEPFSKVILQFCPDSVTQRPFTKIPAASECFIMVSDNIDLGRAPFRFPEALRC